MNPSFLRETFGDDPETISEILRDYLESALAIVGEIDAAFNARASVEVGDAAHKLKSSSRAVGANAVAELCEILETAGKAADWDTIEVQYPTLAPAMAAVRTYVEAL